MRSCKTREFQTAPWQHLHRATHPGQVDSRCRDGVEWSFRSHAVHSMNPANDESFCKYHSKILFTRASVSLSARRNRACCRLRPNRDGGRSKHKAMPTGSFRVARRIPATSEGALNSKSRIPCKLFGSSDGRVFDRLGATGAYPLSGRYRS
jgi:hypothetical protein